MIETLKGVEISGRRRSYQGKSCARPELHCSDKAQVAFHSDELVRIVGLKGAFEVECLIALFNHLFCLLLEDEVGAIVGVGRLEVATSCL